MYRGRIVEEGTVRRIFTAPREDYTRMLLAATPTIFDQRAELS
jgi:ABC-type dipeptide/oligopeptide/nickel transport system ATPase component